MKIKRPPRAWHPGGKGLPVGLVGLAMLAAASGCGSNGSSDPRPEVDYLTIYSGRSEEMVGPLIERFQAQTGIEVKVRYGGTAEMAATILEEGEESLADVYFGQDAGALGTLARESRLESLPESILQQVYPRFRARDGRWVGISGRARVVVYNTDALEESALPDSVKEFTDPRWRGRLGWSPANGSFQAFVTAMRLIEGDEATREWLEGIVANEPKVYPNNMSIFEAVGNGEIDVGLANHYYLFRFLSEAGEELPVRIYNPRGGGPGALINIAGVGILSSARNPDAAGRFVAFLLSETSQQYFARETYEYPTVGGIAIHPLLKAIPDIRTPEIELGDLVDLRGTLDLLQQAGVL